MQERERKVTQRREFIYNKKDPKKRQISPKVQNLIVVSVNLSLLCLQIYLINQQQSSVIVIRAKVKSVLRYVGEDQLVIFFL